MEEKESRQNRAEEQRRQEVRLLVEHFNVISATLGAGSQLLPVCHTCVTVYLLVDYYYFYF